MTTTLLLYVATAFSFGGGNDVALVHSLADWSTKSVAILADGRRQWPKVFVDVHKDGIASMAKVIQGKLGTTAIEVTRAIGLSSAAWPETLYRTLLQSSYTSGFKKIETEAPECKSGLISYRTKTAPVLISGAFPTGAKHLWTWHWFFENVRVVVDCKDLTEREYADMIARAIGARVVESKGAYYFDIDPRAYRNRTVALAAERFSSLKNPTGEKYDYLLLGSGIKLLTEVQIADLLDQPDGNLSLVKVSNQETLRIASLRLRTQYPVDPEDGIQRHPSAAKVWSEIRNAIDWSRPPGLIFYAGGMAACHYPGSKKMPGGVVL